MPLATCEEHLEFKLARYYDSRTGTFCSADPLAGSPGDPQSWNRYPYGRNDPIDMTDPSGQNWFTALLDVLFAIPPKPWNGQEPTEQGSPSDSMPGGGGVWNDQWSVPYGGLTNGIQTALGLPTMADISPIFNVAPAYPSLPIYCQPNVMAAMQLAYNTARQMNNLSQIHDAAHTIEAGFPVYRTADGGGLVGNGPATAPPQIQTGPSSGFQIQARYNAQDFFHTHPDSASGEPSYPGNTAGEGTPDTVSAAANGGRNIYVISWSGLSVAPANGPVKPPKDGSWNPWIVQGNGLDDWLKKLKQNCAQ